MNPLGTLGRTLIVLGVILAVLGVLLTLAGKVPWLGRLPGDFRFSGKGWTVYFPLATMLILSVVLTLLLNLFRR
jgi:hypothetical protein